MGKTAAGAVWLDPERTSPYDFYQYWINTADADVERFLALFTYLPMDEVRRLGAKEGADLREAKEILAYEATRLSHGAEEADKARAASRAAFGALDEAGMTNLPTTEIEGVKVAEGISAVDLIVAAGLRTSRNEARRLIQGGGFRINDRRVDDVEAVIGAEDFPDDSALLRAGKKSVHRVLVKN
jgi:tyrosyl-tRNA synthetase